MTINQKEKQKGLTLIELLVVIGILGFLGLAASQLLGDTFKNNRELSESLLSIQEARAAVKQMVSEIRIANSANTGAYPIATASSTQFSFYADTNDDGIYNRIRYYYLNGSLMRGEIIPTGSPLTYNPANETVKTLAHNIINSASGIFFYHNEAYTGVEAPLSGAYNTSDIRLVHIVLTVDASTSTPPAAITEESTVFIRTFKTGS
jgi:prepilin-type N-terminal cleavage/methylation domain-containing protein